LGEFKLAFLGFVEARQELVEEMVVSLSLLNVNQTGFLEQKVLGGGSHNLEIFVVNELDVLAEAGRVVVADRLGVSKRCDERSEAYFYEKKEEKKDE
tara:strand:- start:729 stop:1019 length:291 start_codon:yes stop_codon:yes gene_type:complete